MKGFFLLFTISLLVMLQIQRGMLQDTTQGTVTTTTVPARTTTARTPARTTAARTTPHTPARTTARTPARTTTRATVRTTAPATGRTTAPATTGRTAVTMGPSASFASTKKQTGAAPALSSLGGVSILIILTNTFIQLFHLS